MELLANGTRYIAPILRRRYSMHLPAAALVLLGAFACCLAATADGLHITWLPLGDSITWGCGNGVLPHVTPPGCRATRKHLNDCGCERDSG